MGVIMAERTLKRTAQRYRRGTRKQKARILDEFVATHDCTRNHASWLLRSWGKTVFSHQGGELVKIVVGQRRARRTIARVYDQQVYEALERIWYLYGGMCGKRLIGVLRNQLPLLEKFDEISLDATVREKLQGISAATIDRLLRAEKHKLQVRGRSHTKPTTRLLRRSSSAAREPIARTTTASPSRRTTRWCGSMSAICGWRPSRRSIC